MRQPRQVDLLHHLLQPGMDVADQIGHGTLELDLAARHRAGAELVLQPHNSISVAPAVLQPPRQCE
jgi:hypothetical protein